jgi:hypothetical protein
MIRERKHNLRQLQSARPRRLDPRLYGLALFLVCLGALVAFMRPAVGAAAAPAPEPQRRRTQTRRPAQAARRPRVDWTKFSHATKGHYEDCASCHITNTRQKMTLEKPDLVAYPDHPACTNCHRREFFSGPFSGAAPAICADCHTQPRPSKKLPLFPFPKPTPPPSQFADLFPHVNHVKATSLSQFKRVIGPNAKQQDTCLYCHKLDKSEQKAVAGAAKDAFVPPPGTFMTTPTTHASCFQCHWQKGVEGKDIEPLANQCVECHANLALAAKMPAGTPTPAATPAARPTATPKPAESAHASFNFAPARFAGPLVFVPALSLQQQRGIASPRVSPKFRHELNANPKEDPHQYRPDRQDDKGEPEKITCLKCHTAVKTSKALDNLRLAENKVQIQTCASTACHTALSGTAALGLSVLRELRERGKDKSFDCAFCHTPPESTSKLFPCDHYEVVYKTATENDKPAPESLKKLIQASPCKSILPKE